MSANKPRIRRATPLGTDDNHSMTYHDVPFPELEAARAQGTIVVAACGMSFLPKPIPQKPIVVGQGEETDIKIVIAVKMYRCKVCAEINYNHFGDRPVYWDEGC